MCAVADLIGRISRMDRRVNAVDIIHVTVSIIVNAVVRDFAGIGPEVVEEVLVIQLRAGIDDSHDNVGGVFLAVPALGRVDVGVRNGRVVEAPLIRKIGVIRRDEIPPEESGSAYSASPLSR